MDDDIAFALRIQANDNGIFDEEIIQDIIEASKNNNPKLVDDLLESQPDDDDMPDLEPNPYIFSSGMYGNIHQSGGLLNQLFNSLNSQPLFQRIEPTHNQMQSINLSEIFDIVDNSNIPENTNGPHNIRPINLNQIPLELLKHYFPEHRGDNNDNDDKDDEEVGEYVPWSGSTGPNSFFSISSNDMWNHVHTFGNQVTLDGIAEQINGFLGTIGNMAHQFIDVPLTLTEKALEKIKDVTYKELKENLPNLDLDEKCAICFALLTEDPDNYKYNCLPCNHVFHSDCIKQYLKDYDYHCPICKEECGEHVARTDEQKH